MKNSQMMDFAIQQKLLRLLVANAQRILNAKFGVNAAEVTFFEIVELIRSEQNLKATFLEMAGETFLQPDGWGCTEHAAPLELVELVAHEFRWPEIADLADKRIEKYFKGDRSLAIGDIAMRIRAALSDDWEDREFYARYETATPNTPTGATK
jgi:hypothetical protein